MLTLKKIGNSCVIASFDSTVNVVITSSFLKAVKEYGIDKLIEDCTALEIPLEASGGTGGAWDPDNDQLTEQSIIKLAKGDTVIAGNIHPADVDKAELASNLEEELESLKDQSPVCNAELFGAAFLYPLILSTEDSSSNVINIVPWAAALDETVANYICDCVTGLTPLEMDDLCVLINCAVYRALSETLNSL